MEGRATFVGFYVRHSLGSVLPPGPLLAGHEALFQARQGENRILVLLEIMQRSQRLTLPETAVNRA